MTLWTPLTDPEAITTAGYIFDAAGDIHTVIHNRTRFGDDSARLARLGTSARSDHNAIVDGATDALRQARLRAALFIRTVIEQDDTTVNIVRGLYNGTDARGDVRDAEYLHVSLEPPHRFGRHVLGLLRVDQPNSSEPTIVATTADVTELRLFDAQLQAAHAVELELLESFVGDTPPNLRQV